MSHLSVYPILSDAIQLLWRHTFSNYSYSHFDRLVGHLNSSLKELEVPRHEIDGIMEMFESMRDEVPCR